MGQECGLKCVLGSITLSGSQNDPCSSFHETWQAILQKSCAVTEEGRKEGRGVGKQTWMIIPGWVRSRLLMIQSCAVDFVGLDVFDLAVEGFSTEDSKPVGGLVVGVHVLLILPQRHSEHLVVLFIGKEQAARVTFLHL